MMMLIELILLSADNTDYCMVLRLYQCITRPLIAEYGCTTDASWLFTMETMEMIQTSQLLLDLLKWTGLRVNAIYIENSIQEP